MKKIFPLAAAIVYTLFVSGGAGLAEILPPPELNPLNQTPVPEPPSLSDFVKNKAAAIRLGKAFFWDMQTGSDGIQACASCHFSAGADNRKKNTINPGAKAGDTIFGNNSLGVEGFPQFGPNYTLQPEDFPLHQRARPADLQSSAIIRDTNDVIGSQGVRLSDFVDVVLGQAVENAIPAADPVFNVNGANTRRVTGRNTPTVINAIFNFANFWDGRANFLFNGENPFGPADQNAGVWLRESGNLVKRPVVIQFASLASQATGPALDDTEMSARGRTFPKLGRKMLSLTPLGKQLVHPGDSVLGPLSNAVRNPEGTISGAKGLSVSYAQMIRDAFRNELWEALELTPDGYTQMEANFSLFWGLAIQLYLATQVSDDTPFDRWLAGNSNALTEEQKQGFNLFQGIGKCVNCHGGIELTNASAASAAFINNFDNALIELMFVSDGTQVIYDEGFNNSAVRPTPEDIGRGGAAPFINPLTGLLFPLSFSRLAELQAQNLLPFQTPILPLFVPSDFPVNANGSFKVPGLRNVELTAPYFHNGSVMTLEEVVDFYVRGGNFPRANLSELDPLIGEGLPLLQADEAKHAAIVAFMKSLTDERVRNESAPFDHPELFIPEGDPEILRRIPARDASGEAASAQSLTLNAVASPTTLTSQTISGTVELGLVPAVTVDTPAVVGEVIVSGTDWSVLISGLVEGPNVITVSVIDSSNVQTTLTATITVITNEPPAITSIPVTAAAVGQPYSYDVNASDPNGDVLTYSLASAPAGMLINAATGLITWTPAFGQAGTNEVIAVATDSRGASDSQIFTITVASAAYSISGRVTDSRRKPLSGVTLTLSGAANKTTVTDSLGNYSFTGLANGSYVVTPSFAGYRFIPSKRSVGVSGANVTSRNFYGVRI